MYSRRNSALSCRRASVVGAVVGVGVVVVVVVSERKEKTCSSRRIHRRARETRCSVRVKSEGVGGRR